LHSNITGCCNDNRSNVDIHVKYSGSFMHEIDVP
jgi:hypothetical protein